MKLGKMAAYCSVLLLVAALKVSVGQCDVFMWAMATVGAAGIGLCLGHLLSESWD